MSRWWRRLTRFELRLFQLLWPPATATTLCGLWLEQLGVLDDKPFTVNLLSSVSAFLFGAPVAISVLGRLARSTEQVVTLDLTVRRFQAELSTFDQRPVLQQVEIPRSEAELRTAVKYMQDLYFLPVALENLGRIVGQIDAVASGRLDPLNRTRLHTLQRDVERAARTELKAVARAFGQLRQLAITDEDWQAAVQQAVSVEKELLEIRTRGVELIVALRQ